MKEGYSMDKNYKRIDWSKRKPIEECVYSGDTNNYHLDITIKQDNDAPIDLNSIKESLLIDRSIYDSVIYLYHHGLRHHSDYSSDTHLSGVSRNRSTHPNSQNHPQIPL